MMDLGANVCTARDPRCLLCPVNADCVARHDDRIAELPGRKARAAPRRKRIAMLDVLRAGEVLLEKRAPAGRWGGLWSLPEAAADQAPAEALRRGWRLAPAQGLSLGPFGDPVTHLT